MVALTKGDGSVLAINNYDEYGIPAQTNLGRFQYTGQTWLPELGMYYYKARIYSPTLGRFLQTDPIGYGDGVNIYAYVQGDPVNASDPSGLCRRKTVNYSWYRLNEDGSVGEWLSPAGSETVLIGCNTGGGSFGSSFAQQSGNRFGGGGGGASGLGEESDNCETNPDARRALADLDVQRQIDRAINQSYDGTGFWRWEHGFWTSPSLQGNGVTPWGIGTSREIGLIAPDDQRPWFGGIRQYFAGLGPPNVFFHTHQRTGLSQDDLDWAANNSVTIISVTRNGSPSCGPRQQ